MQLRICFTIASEYDDALKVEVSHQLHRRGQDFQLYANTGYTLHERDSFWFQYLARSLFVWDSGVQGIYVRSPFRFIVDYSHAITQMELEQRILDALRRSGVDVIDVNEEERRLQNEADDAMYELERQQPSRWSRFWDSFGRAMSR